MGHLVLTRGKEQSVLIGDNIRVKVLRIQDGRVRLAIEAPRDIEVDREEIRLAKERGRE